MNDTNAAEFSYDFDSKKEILTISDSGDLNLDYAFYNCPNIRSVTIPRNVLCIGEKAFGYLDADSVVKDFTIKGYRGTSAESRAKEQGFNFEAID